MKGQRLDGGRGRRVQVAFLEPAVGVQHEIPCPARPRVGQVRPIEGHLDFLPRTIDGITVVGCPQQRGDVAVPRPVPLERKPLGLAAQRLVIPDEGTIGRRPVLPGIAAVVKVRGHGRQPGDAPFGPRGLVDGEKGLAPVQLQVRGEPDSVVVDGETSGQVDENGLVFPRRKAGVGDRGPPLPLTVRRFQVGRDHGGVFALGQGQVGAGLDRHDPAAQVEVYPLRTLQIAQVQRDRMHLGNPLEVTEPIVTHVQAVPGGEMGQDVAPALIAGRHGQARLRHRVDFEIRVGRRQVLFVHVDVRLRRMVDDQQLHFVHVHRVPQFLHDTDLVLPVPLPQLVAPDLHIVVRRVRIGRRAGLRQGADGAPRHQVRDEYVPVAVPGVQRRARTLEPLGFDDEGAGFGIDPVLGDAVAPGDPDHVGLSAGAETHVGYLRLDQERLVMRPRVYFDRGSDSVEVVLAASFQRRGKLDVEPPVRVAAVVPERVHAPLGQQQQIEVAVIVQVAGFHVLDGRGQFRQQRRLRFEPAVPKVTDQPQSPLAGRRSAGKRQVDETVVVEVEGPGDDRLQAVARAAYRRRRTVPVEPAAAFVPQQPASDTAGPRHEQVQRAVVIEIGRGDRIHPAPPDFAETVRPVHPPALARVSVEPVRPVVMPCDHVHGAVQVEVAPGQRLGGERTIDRPPRSEARRGSGLFK